jgi:hypothetical protein
MQVNNTNNIQTGKSENIKIPEPKEDFVEIVPYTGSTKEYTWKKMGIIFTLPQNRTFISLGNVIKILTDKKDNKGYKEYISVQFLEIDPREPEPSPEDLQAEQAGTEVLGFNFYHKREFLELQKYEKKLINVDIDSEAMKELCIRIGNKAYFISLNNVESDQPTPENRDLSDYYTHYSERIQGDTEIINNVERILGSMKVIN